MTSGCKRNQTFFTIHIIKGNKKVFFWGGGDFEMEKSAVKKMEYI